MGELEVTLGPTAPLIIVTSPASRCELIANNRRIVHDIPALAQSLETQINILNCGLGIEAQLSQLLCAPIPITTSKDRLPKKLRTSRLPDSGEEILVACCYTIKQCRWEGRADDTAAENAGEVALSRVKTELGACNQWTEWVDNVISIEKQDDAAWVQAHLGKPVVVVRSLGIAIRHENQLNAWQFAAHLYLQTGFHLLVRLGVVDERPLCSAWWINDGRHVVQDCLNDCRCFVVQEGGEDDV